MWWLKASAHKLTVILEEQQFALAQVARIDDALGEMSEDTSEDDSERDDGDVKELAGGLL